MWRGSLLPLGCEAVVISRIENLIPEIDWDRFALQREQAPSPRQASRRNSASAVSAQHHQPIRQFVALVSHGHVFLEQGATGFDAGHEAL